MRVVLVVLGVVLLLVLPGAVALDVYLRRQYEPTLAAHREATIATVDRFCEVQTALSADPFFHEPRTEGDAGPLLNPWVTWGNTVPAVSPLSLPDGMDLPLFSKQWLTTKEDLAEVNFSWMQQLHAFDRWDLLVDSPAGAQQPLNWTTMPMPNFLQLMTWARLRLVHGMRSGAVLGASKDVRQLAWLCYRTETMLGGAIAVAILKLEREAHDAMTGPPAEWQPMIPLQLARFKAVVHTSHAYSGLLAPVDIGTKARACGTPAVGRCLALSESGAMARWLRPLAAEDFAKSYAALDSELAVDGCATSFPRTMWSEGAQISDEDEAGAGFLLPNGAKALSNLPSSLVGSRIAGILLATAVPGGDLSVRLSEASAVDGGTP